MTAGRVTAKTKIFELSVVLREVRPPVRRRVQVPGEITLAQLHDVLQLALGWTDSHLHEFRVGKDRYGCPDPDWGDDDVADESKVKLFRLVGQAGQVVVYLYDFGDGWTHDITVEKVLAPQPGTGYPRCVSGRRACPPEDVGGPWGYEHFLGAISDPSHDEHAEWLEWVGGGFDPDEFDLDEVNEVFEAMAWSPLLASVGTARSR
jgi:hypothetical protein